MNTTMHKDEDKNIWKEVIAKLTECFIELRFFIRQFLKEDILYSLGESVDPVVKVRKFMKVYMNVLDILTLIKRQELQQKFGKDNLSRIMDYIKNEVDKLLELCDRFNIDIHIEEYVPLIMSLVMSLYRYVRELLLKNVGPVPELDALAYEITRLGRLIARQGMLLI